jgi:hypothetical protein
MINMFIPSAGPILVQEILSALIGLIWYHQGKCLVEIAIFFVLYEIVQSLIFMNFLKVFFLIKTHELIIDLKKN